MISPRITWCTSHFCKAEKLHFANIIEQLPLIKASKKINISRNGAQANPRKLAESNNAVPVERIKEVTTRLEKGEE
jgi:hypothetical protein